MSQDNTESGAQDAQLVQRLRDGDKSALNDLMRKYQEPFRRYIRQKFPGLEEEAEDIVQDFFLLKVIDKSQQIEQPDRFSSWSYTAIDRLCIDRIRKKSSQPLDSIEDIEESDMQLHTPNEEYRDGLVHKRWLFLDSIKKLPIAYQTVLINRKLKKVSYKQIAEKMNTPRNTVGTWIDRAEEDAEEKSNKICSENEINWTQTYGPYGGTITALHASSEETLFAGTLTAGIFCSIDGGDTWVHAGKGLGDMPPAIRSFTHKKNTFYAATDSGLFDLNLTKWKWASRNATWRQLTYGSISGVAIIGDTLYIRRPGKGVFFSNDDGKSWTKFDSGLTDQGVSRLFASGKTLFAQTRCHVFRLKAGENSWTKLTIKDSSKKTTVESDITSFAVSGEIAYAITADGELFRSTDMGDWWQSIKPKPMQGFDCKLAALKNTVFCIDSGSADGQVLRSTDAGSTWTAFNTNLTNQTILSIAILSAKALCIGTYNGIFRVTNSKKSWTKVTPGVTDTSCEDLVFFKNAFYAVTGDGIVKSVDAEISWELVNDGLIAKARVELAGSKGLLLWAGAKLAVSGDRLYAATCESNTSRWNLATPGIYRLAENENLWLSIDEDMPSFNDRIDTIDRLAISEETFYVIAHGRLYRWRVREALWTDLGLRVWHERGFAVSGKTVYVQREDGKILRSSDEGDTWMDVSHLPKSNVEVQPKRDTPLYRFDSQTDSPIFKLDLEFVGDTICAASRYDGVYISIDHGKTWWSIADGLPDGWIKIQLIDGKTIYGTNSHGVFRFMRGQDSWKMVAPIQHTVRSLAFDGTAFYAITDSKGVFRLSLYDR